MSLTIAEALHQAQEAINGGNYGTAVSTCRRLVAQFPSYVAAYQLLGEAYREQGQVAEAESAFSAALLRHQRHPGAYLGLGLIADDHGTFESALAFCQVAWELSPNQGQLRETLTRVAMRRHRADGDLQYSRAALAQLHVNASRLRRAVAEFRTALADLPDRVDLQLGLAECLWRLGQDAEAAQLCRVVLETFTESVPALVMLTDIERRGGNAVRAADLLKRLRAADPDGGITASMVARNALADRAFIALPVGAIPDLTAEEVAPAAGPVRIGPAPDFGSFVPRAQEIPTPSMDELQPITLEELGGSSADQLPAGAGDFEFDDADLQPISIEELGGLPRDFPSASVARLGIGAAAAAVSFMRPPTDEPITEYDMETIGALPAAQADDFGGFEDFSDQPFVPFVPAAAAAVAAEAVSPDFTDLEIADPAVMDPRVMDERAAAGLDAAFDRLLADEPAVPVADDAIEQQLTVADDEPIDDLAALAASLEGDVAEAISRAGDPMPPPPAPPAAGAPTGYTSMLQSIDQQGLQPFDPHAAAMPEPRDVPPMPPMDDSVIEEARPAKPQTDEFGRITHDWDSIDDEIAAAMPEGMQRGYTDELRSLTEIGLAPFELEDDEAEEVQPFNPFAAEPAVPTPPAATAPATEEDLLGGLQPFAFEEFEGGAAGASSTSLNFGQGTIQSTQTGSIVPSDADLEALLALGGEDMPEPAPTTQPERADLPTALLAVRGGRAQAPSGRAATEAQTESDLLRMVPGPREDELDALTESSRAVTRQLGNQGLEEFADPAASAQASGPADLEDLDAPVSLTSGTELFTRARRAKEELVTGGLIAGDRELSSRELDRLQDSIPTQELDLDSSELDLDDVPASVIGEQGDILSLRAALDATPDDPELRWWLAEGLREQGDVSEAYGEYRWLIRNAPERHDAVISVLLTGIERDQEPETAHRLLGDIYRRRGDVTRASNHAALALQSRRRGARVR